MTNNLCVFILRSLLFAYKGDRTRALSSAWRTDRGGFTDWTLAQVFSREFCKISKNTFFTEHLGTTTSVDKCLFQINI